MNRTLTRGITVAAVMALATFGLAACGDDNNSGDSSNVNIAFMGDLTGANKALGINIRNGAKLAFDQYNATNPKIKVTLKEYDSQGEPAQATALAPKVIDDGNVALVGPAFSGETADTGEQWEEAGLPFISASATRVALSENGWKTFHRVLADDGFQGPGISEFLTKGASKKKVAVIDDASEYGKGLADQVASSLKTDGATVVVREAVAATGTAVPNYSSTITKIKGAGADAVFYGGYYAQGGPFAKQLKDGGVSALFISGDGSLDPAFIKGAAAAANGSVLTCTCGLITAAATGTQKTFYDDYKAAFNTEPGTYSPEGFDAATAFIKALQDGKTSRADINTFVSAIDFEGVSKQIKFESDGNIAGGTVLIYEIKDNKIGQIGTSETAKLS